MGPFFFEVPAPANEEVDGTRNRGLEPVALSPARIT